MKAAPLLALAATLCGTLVPVATAAADATKPYIVVLEKSSAPAARVATSDIAGDEHFTPTQRYDDALHGFAARLDAHDVRAVRDDPRVAAVVPDRPVRMTGETALTPGDNVPTGVRRVGAGTATTTRQASTANVAVIDTGIDLTHPDLNAVAGANCNGTGAPTDGNGHGTHVAGIIAAKNNGAGAVGVAPGTKVFAVRVLSAAGSGYTSNIVCGIDWVTSTRTDADPGNDIAVANMSLGGGLAPYGNCGRTVNDPEHIAICNSVAAGVTYVVAAGNSTTDEQNFAPANYGEVLSVTAVSDSDGLPGGTGGTVSCIGNADDSAASYSNYATRAADIAHTIAAPGSCIRSTYPGNRYATMSGTSMASPHVAGLVALCEGEAGAHGPCWGQPPATVVSMMMAAASSTAAAAPAGVFDGAPSRPIGGRYYGDLASTAFPSATGAMPVNTAVPAISGTATTSSTLTATQGTWTGAGNTYAMRWLRCTTTSLATASYQPTFDDAGKLLRVRVVATNAAGSAMVRSEPTAAVVAPAPPALRSAPVVTGDALVGRTLTGHNGTWGGTAPIAYAVQWQRCTSATALTSCADIAGASAESYVPVAADLGRYLRVAYKATNMRGTVIARSDATRAVATPPAPPAGVIAPINTRLPAVVGTAKVGWLVGGDPGMWAGTPGTLSAQWRRCATTDPASCVDVAGGTDHSYTLTSSDRGKYVRVAITGRNAKGAVTAVSPPFGPVA